MTHKDFSALLERRLKQTKEKLSSKSKEYSTVSDKLHNFKETARRRNQTAPEALNGMLEKHLQSYYDMIEKQKVGILFSRDQIDERFGDIINYFILQEALFTELTSD